MFIFPIFFFSTSLHILSIFLNIIYNSLFSKIKYYYYYISRSSEDLVHRLFVCIAGVADQLQTNFASDLRNILKCVFLMNSSQAIEDIEEPKDQNLASTVNAPVDTAETESIHERQESLPEYEDIEENILIHDRSTDILIFFIPEFYLINMCNC